MANTIIRIDAAPTRVDVTSAPVRIDLSAAQGPGGPPGVAGPNSVTSTTTSNGTADLSLSNVSTTTLTITGMSVAPTAVTTTSTTQLATTAFVQQELASGVAVAKNLEFLARNKTGATLAKGSIVYIDDATGNRPTITKAQADSDANSAQTIGFVKTDITNNGTGFVIVRGELENINTSALDEGDQLYLSASSAGAWTTTKPSAPQHLVYVGIVIRSHPTQGVILVAIQNGYELDELHDVAISSPAAKQVIKRNAGNTLWVNEAIVSADVSDATSAATASRIVIRDGSGAASLAGLTNSGNLNLATGTTFTYGTGIASAHRTALGLGSLATQSGTFSGTHSGTSSGTNTGDQDLSGLVPRLSTLSVSGISDGDSIALNLSLIEQSSLTNGRRTWIGDGATLFHDNGSGEWKLEYSDGFASYTAAIVDDSQEPWKLNSGWAVAIGSGQPNFSLSPAALQPVQSSSGTVALTQSLNGEPDKLTNGYIRGSTTVDDDATWAYGTIAAEAHRIALGGVGDSSTGTALFGAATAAAALTTLGGGTAATGTGAVVLANTPTLVTPNIGAATGSSVNLTQSGNPRFSVAEHAFTNAGITVSSAANNSARLGFVGSTAIIERGGSGGFSFTDSAGTGPMIIASRSIRLNANDLRLEFSTSNSGSANITTSTGGGGPTRINLRNIGVLAHTTVRVQGGESVGRSYFNTEPPTDGLIVEGNVGIGTTSPAEKLDVVGNIKASGTLAVTGASTLTGGATFGGSTQQAATRIALGATTTGAELFLAADPAAARTTLGIRTFTKPSDESRSSNTTYTVDSYLKDIPLVAGKSYRIDFFLAAYVPNPEGGKARLVAPLATGTVPIQAGFYNTSQWGNGNASAINQSTSGSVRYFQLAAAVGYSQNRALVGVAYTGVLSASGVLSLEWAQNASGVNATIMLGGSIITVTEL